MKLHDLVESIMDSVSEAQSRVEQQNIENLLQYFDHNEKDDSLTPKSIELKFPNAQVDQNGETMMENGAPIMEHQSVHVPLLSMLQLNPIKIKDMSVQFDVELGDIETVKAPPEADSGKSMLSKLLNREQSRKIMNTDINGSSGFGRKKGRNAEVTITFESGELPEGYLKVNSHLMKLF